MRAIRTTEKTVIWVKPVYNDHLYNKVYYLQFIQKYVLMKTEGTNIILVTMSAFCMELI